VNASGRDQTPTLGTELDLRTLRYFVAAAEELHFTRAAARLFVAQQALSREVQKLERELGVALFVRTTRRVVLTADGERLLTRARHLLAIHDQTLREMRDPARPLIVDLLSEGRLTGRRILDAARQAAPHLEFRGRHGGGFGAALRTLLPADVDVAFGRVDGTGQTLPSELAGRLVRLEPLAVLLPEHHPLASYEKVPLEVLRGLEIDAGAGNPRAPEWLDLAQQLLTYAGARATPPHVPAEGPEEQAHHLVKQGLPILTAIDHRPVAGGVVRVLSGPVPLYPWSMVHRRDAQAAGVSSLERAAARLAGDEGWLDVPADAWLPQPEATLLGERVPSRLRP
jgi:DNA-binding transcriptional LysR family regulator